MASLFENIKDQSQSLETKLSAIPDNQKYKNGVIFEKKAIEQTLLRIQSIDSGINITELKTIIMYTIEGVFDDDEDIRIGKTIKKRGELVATINSISDNKKAELLTLSLFISEEVITSIEKEVAEAEKAIAFDKGFKDTEKGGEKIFADLDPWNKDDLNTFLFKIPFNHSLYNDAQARMADLKLQEEERFRIEKGKEITRIKKLSPQEKNKEVKNKLTQELDNFYERQKQSLDFARQEYFKEVSSSAQGKNSLHRSLDRFGYFTGLKREVGDPTLIDGGETKKKINEAKENYDLEVFEMASGLLKTLENQMKEYGFTQQEISYEVNRFRVSLLAGQNFNTGLVLSPPWSYKHEKEEYGKVIAESYQREGVPSFASKIAKAVAIPLRVVDWTGRGISRTLFGKAPETEIAQVGKTATERAFGSAVVVGVFGALTGGAFTAVQGARLGVSALFNGMIEVFTKNPARREKLKEQFSWFYSGDPKFQTEMLKKLENGELDPKIQQTIKDKEFQEIASGGDTEFLATLKRLEEMDQTSRGRQVLRFWIKRLLAMTASIGTVYGAEEAYDWWSKPEEVPAPLAKIPTPVEEKIIVESEEKPKIKPKPAPIPKTAPVEHPDPAPEALPPFVWEDRWERFEYPKGYGWDDFAQDPGDDVGKQAQRFNFIKAFCEKIGNDGTNYKGFPGMDLTGRDSEEIAKAMNEKYFYELQKKSGFANSNWATSYSAPFQYADRAYPTDFNFDSISPDPSSVSKDWGDNFKTGEQKRFVRFLAKKLNDFYVQEGEKYEQRGYLGRTNYFFDFLEKNLKNIGEINSAKVTVNPPPPPETKK